MGENEIATGESLKEFIRHVLDEKDKGLTVKYDEATDRFILRYIFKMNGKQYLGKIPLSRVGAFGLAEYILAVNSKLTIE